MIKLRRRLSFANVTAVLALLVALSGGAYALSVPNNSVGTKQLKKNAVTTPKIKKNAVNGSKVATGSLRFNDMRAGEVVDFKRAIRPGRTMTGLYAIRGINEFEQYHVESFGFRIPAPALGHWIAAGQPSTPECPGTIAEPDAAAGHLCVYERFASNVGGRFFLDPRNFTVRSTSFEDGFGLVISNTTSGTSYVSTGSWALTTATTTPSPLPASNGAEQPSGDASSVTGG